MNQIDHRLSAAIEDARQREVLWDDLRERRVLSQLMDEVQAPPLSPPRRHGRVVALATVATAVTAVAAAAVLWLAPSRAADGVVPLALTTPDLEAVDAPATPAIPHVDPARLMLADGSSAQLDRAAHVQIVTQTAALVALAQDSGRVRYEVAPDRTRDFEVDARGVHVHVVGTIFSVDVGTSHVAVAVERGTVEVTARTRSVTLQAGDSVSLAIDAAAPDEATEVAQADPTPTPTTAPHSPKSAATPRPSIDALLREADDARARSDAATAAAALGKLVVHYPKDPRAVSAYFQLGKVERSRGRDAAAARAFERCVKRSPKGALAEDARAEAAVSWDAAGRADKAEAAARAYLGRYPEGTHAARMRRLVDTP